MKALNLYAGIGGNRKDWPSHWEVTNVESDPNLVKELKRNFPNDKVVLGDAHEYLKLHYQNYDFIWSSPPCQTHSRMNRINCEKYHRHEYIDPQLFQQIIFLQENFQGGYCVENVKAYYGSIFSPVCYGRHCFWTNFDIECLNYEVPNITLFDLSLQELSNHFRIELSKNIYLKDSHDPKQPYRNAVHPELGELISNRFENRSIQSTLFGVIE